MVHLSKILLGGRYCRSSHKKSAQTGNSLGARPVGSIQILTSSYGHTIAHSSRCVKLAQGYGASYLPSETGSTAVKTSRLSDLTPTPFADTIVKSVKSIGLASFTVPIHTIGAVFFCAPLDPRTGYLPGPNPDRAGTKKANPAGEFSLVVQGSHGLGPITESSLRAGSIQSRSTEFEFRTIFF